jgi:hypothetical protein
LIWEVCKGAAWGRHENPNAFRLPYPQQTGYNRNLFYPTQGNTMAENTDDQFFLRADAYINLANGQLKDASRESVCASIMFGAARFNIWTHACDAQTSEQMATNRNEAIAYFAEQYRLMLEQHIDDYINNFDKYMKGENADE